MAVLADCRGSAAECQGDATAVEMTMAHQSDWHTATELANTFPNSSTDRRYHSYKGITAASESLWILETECTPSGHPSGPISQSVTEDANGPSSLAPGLSQPLRGCEFDGAAGVFCASPMLIRIYGSQKLTSWILSCKLWPPCCPRCKPLDWQLLTCYGALVEIGHPTPTTTLDDFKAAEVLSFSVLTNPTNKIKPS